MAVFKFRNLKNGQATPIPPGQYTVGRADDSYVHLEDPSVSRRHARLSNTEHGFFVEDLGSANGTALRGAYINHRMQLEMGEIIHIGSVSFRIDPEIVGEPESQTTTSMRPINRAYLTRDTERIQLPIVDPPKPVVMDQPITPYVNISKSEENQPGVNNIAEPKATVPAPSMKPEVENEEETHLTPEYSGWMMPFLVGLGLGVLLGIFLTKLYLESGSRAPLWP